MDGFLGFFLVSLALDTFFDPPFLLQGAKFRDEEITFDTNRKRWEKGPNFFPVIFPENSSEIRPFQEKNRLVDSSPEEKSIPHRTFRFLKGFPISSYFGQKSLLKQGSLYMTPTQTMHYH